MSPVRRLRITGGPNVRDLRVTDADTGQELHVRSIRITGGYGTCGGRDVEVEVRMPATIDVVAVVAQPVESPEDPTITRIPVPVVLQTPGIPAAGE